MVGKSHKEWAIRIVKSVAVFCGANPGNQPWFAEAAAELGATLADTENLINDPLSIESVVVAILFAEQKDGPVRVSFRSKAPLAGERETDIDVSEIAGHFGGGGHRRAAGARVDGSLEEVRTRVVSEVESLLNGQI